MKKINIVKKAKEFNRIIKKRQGITNQYFIINTDQNTDNIPKFGITFVKGIGNAVLRNKLKRQTKAIIDNHKNIYQCSLNYIIIIKKAAVEVSYQELENKLVSLFFKIKEKPNEKK